MQPLEPELSSYATFASALLDPTYATPAIVIGPAGKGAAKRYNIYRNNVTVSLINALAAVYPAVQRITGVEFFRAMARFHVRATPPRSPLLFEYGHDFPAFVETYEYTRRLPWLADVARIERAWLDAHHAGDAEPLFVDALAAFPPERRQKRCSPDIRRRGLCDRHFRRSPSFVPIAARLLSARSMREHLKMP